MDQVGDIMVWLESPAGSVFRFHFLASAGQETLLGERCPEVMLQGPGGGYATRTAAESERVIARVERRGWKRHGQTPSELAAREAA